MFIGAYSFFDLVDYIAPGYRDTLGTLGINFVTGVDAFIVDNDFALALRELIDISSNGKCYVNPPYIDCDCSQGIEEVFRPVYA